MSFPVDLYKEVADDTVYKLTADLMWHTDPTWQVTISGARGDFAIPAMEEIGLRESTTQIRGGATEALRQLAAYCADSKRVATFAKPRTFPAAFNLLKLPFDERTSYS